MILLMLGIQRFDRVRNTQIHEITNIQPLINTVRQRQLRFLGHILRMPEDVRAMQTICSLCSNSWQKKASRQRTFTYPTSRKAAWGYRKWSASTRHCLFSYRLVYLKKLCSLLLGSRMMMVIEMWYFQSSSNIQWKNKILNLFNERWWCKRILKYVCKTEASYTLIEPYKV